LTHSPLRPKIHRNTLLGDILPHVARSNNEPFDIFKVFYNCEEDHKYRQTAIRLSPQKGGADVQNIR
jgi:hypothetical protein